MDIYGIHKQGRKIQGSDEIMRSWIKAVGENRKPRKDNIMLNKTNSAFLKAFEHLTVKQRFYSKVDINGEKRLQVVIPETLVSEVLAGLHDEVAHPGRDRTLSLVKDRFWPGMVSDEEKWIAKCGWCIRRKKQSKLAPLVNITTMQPLELVSMDF